MGLGHSPRIVTDGLVFCVDAANARSYPGTGTTWTDLKGGNIGALTNGPTFDGDNGGSIAVDGTNDYVSFSNSSNLSPTDEITISVWYNSDVLPSSRANAYQYCVISKQGFGSPYRSFDIRGDVSDPQKKSLNAAIDINNTSRAVKLGDVVVNTWIQVAFTYNGSSLSGYRNGELVQSLSYTGSIGTNTNNFLLGENPGYNGRYFNGKLNNIYVYNRGLTADEIRQNYLATKERYA